MTSTAALRDLGHDVEWPDAAAGSAVMAGMPGGSGRLGDLAQWIAAAQGSAVPHPPRHPVAVTLGPDPISDVAVRTADLHGVSVRTPHLRDAGGAALADAATLADAVADDGCELLVVAGGADPEQSAAVVLCLLTGAEPVSLLPRDAGAVDTAQWVRRAVQLRDRLRAVLALRETPDELLAGLDCPSLTFAAGLVMRAAARRTPVLLDGPLAAAAAVLCYDVQARAGQWWRLADDSPDPVHRRAAADLGSHPVLDLGLTRSDGLAGLLAVGTVHAAVAVATEHAGAA